MSQIYNKHTTYIYYSVYSVCNYLKICIQGETHYLWPRVIILTDSFIDKIVVVYSPL